MNKALPHIFIILWLLYYQQDGTLLSRICLVILLAMSIYYFGYAISHYYLPSPMKILEVMLVGWTIYGIVPIVFGMGDVSISIPAYTELKNIYISFLPVFVFYVFTQQGILTEKMLRIWFFAFLGLAIYVYFDQRSLVLENKMTHMDDNTNNTGYFVLSLVPLLPLFWRKPVAQYALLGICMVFVFLSFKRGAILGGVVCSVWMMYRMYFIESNKFGKKAIRRTSLRIIMMAVFVVFAIYLVQRTMESSDYFNYRLEKTMERDNSGRNDIYSFFFYHFLNENNPFVFLFGNGAYGTIRLYKNFAHNDWLEIAIDYGLIYVILYIAYWFSIVKMIFKGQRKTITRLILGLFFIIFFSKTIFSMSYNDMTIFASAALGFSIATYEYKNVPERNKIGYKNI